jgi:hypothetical protein
LRDISRVREVKNVTARAPRRVCGTLGTELMNSFSGNVCCEWRWKRKCLRDKSYIFYLAGILLLGLQLMGGSVQILQSHVLQR